MDKIQVKWCAELENYIMPYDCLNDDCECECHLTDKYFVHNKRIIGYVTYDRGLPEEDEPTTYITIERTALTELPALVQDAIAKNPHDTIILTVVN